MEVSAKRAATGAEATVDYDFGGDLDEMVALFGPDVVYQKALGQMVVNLQSWIRSQLDQGKTEAEIREAAQEWKPGQRAQRQSPQEKLRKQFEDLSPEERAELLRQLAAAED